MGEYIRELTTCETTGTRIRHKTILTEAVITGSYKGGFIVDTGRHLGLPFKNISDWDVIEESPILYQDELEQ